MTSQDAEQTGGLLGSLKKAYGRLVLCPRGKHVRSRRRVRKSGEQYRSTCHYCGIPMVRVRKRHWIVDEREA